MNVTPEEAACHAKNPDEAKRMLRDMPLIVFLGKRLGALHLKSIQNDISPAQYAFYRLLWLIKYSTDDLKREGANLLLEEEDKTFRWFAEHVIRKLDIKEGKVEPQ
jgi:hypothetical protein